MIKGDILTIVDSGLCYPSVPHFLNEEERTKYTVGGFLEEGSTVTLERLITHRVFNERILAIVKELFTGDIHVVELRGMNYKTHQYIPDLVSDLQSSLNLLCCNGFEVFNVKVKVDENITSINVSYKRHGNIQSLIEYEIPQTFNMITQAEYSKFLATMYKLIIT